jgi:hypothetical protein
MDVTGVIAKVLSANLIPLLWVGSNFFSTASVADPYASSPYLSVPRTIIWCTGSKEVVIQTNGKIIPAA